MLDTIAGEVRADQEVSRSRFLAVLAPVDDEPAVAALLDRVRAEHPSARHHCSAAVLGGHGEWQRSSDDGEPSGTAGAPMLAALAGAGLTDVAVVVTRYFGGTLLGAGGLVRAYGGVAARAVAGSVRLRREPATRYLVTASLGAAGLVEHHLHRLVGDLDLEVAEGRYAAAGASFEVVVPDRVGSDALIGALAPLDQAPDVTAIGPSLRTRPRRAG